MRKNYKMIISYDGTRYSGWQSQGNTADTIQSKLEAVLSRLAGEKIDVIRYSEDPAEFVAAALSPATVLKVEIDPENPKACKVSLNKISNF